MPASIWWLLVPSMQFNNTISLASAPLIWLAWRRRSVCLVSRLPSSRTQGLSPHHEGLKPLLAQFGQHTAATVGM